MRKALLVLLLFASPAKAAFWNGNEMHEYCRTNRAVITGFVAGVFDKGEVDNTIFTAYAFRPNGPLPDATYLEHAAEVLNYCVPKDVLLSQVVDVYCQYLAANPAQRQKVAAELFNLALTNAWSCVPAAKKR